MIAFVLTLCYTALTLLSPAVLPEEWISLHLIEVLGVVAIAATLVSLFNLAGVSLLSTPETYLAAGLTVATVFSTMATGWLGGASETLLGFLPIIFNFFFIAVSCRSLRRLKAMTFVLVLVALFIIAEGVLALQTNDLTSAYLYPERLVGSVLYRSRGLGVLNDPNDLAQFLVMLLPLLWLRWKKGNFAGNLLFTIVPASLLLWGIYLTHSRGGTLAVVAVLLFGFKDKLGLVKSAVLTGVALMGMLALNVSGGRAINDDDGGRVAMWGTGLSLMKSHPLFGVGKGRFGEYTDNGLTAHNSYVLCLAELGLPGYFLWMGLIVSCWTGLTLVSAGAAKAPRTEETAVEEVSGIAALGAQVEAVPARPDHGMGFGMGVEPEDRAPDKEELAYAAKVLRVAMVGLLTASYFLSRTYSMTLYVLLGMAVALRMTAVPPVRQEVGLLLKRTGMVVTGSILFLVLFVRLRGR